MTGPLPPGQSRADSLAPGGHSNGVQSNHYSSSSPDESAEEFVAAPGHGAVGVFQAPQPVRPRTATVDNTMDIDSPFLDLFGGPPVPMPAPAAPATTDEDDFDFGFDFDDPPVDEAAPVSPPAAPVSPSAPAPFPAPPPHTPPISRDPPFSVDPLMPAPVEPLPVEPVPSVEPLPSVEPVASASASAPV